jgi:hypothetical protein
VYLREVEGTAPSRTFQPLSGPLMRKIERQMNNAITNGINWQSANTEVVSQQNGVSYVYLHGNKIAEVGDDFLKLFDGGYQSLTTKSRLNAILAVHGVPGECVFQKNFEWFIRLWNGTEFFTTEFRNSMKLGALPWNLCLA